MTTSDRLSADEQEILVQERTAELEKTNQVLHAEILERKHAENELIKLKDKLEVEIRETNTLHSLSTRFIESGDSYSIFQEMVKAAIAITRANKGNIQILDPSTGKLGYRVSCHFTRSNSRLYPACSGISELDRQRDNVSQ